jgi:hypothetical protein
VLTPDHDGAVARPAPALTSTPGGYLIDVMIGNLRVHTSHPITEAAAREYARLLWDSFGVEIDGDVQWTC